ncbi:hypothetical protein ZWY2020_017582 [Hordeum vulgare]|nr:hypothetical protein ZWY2020_017582 [Hordeum vulgare]
MASQREEAEQQYQQDSIPGRRSEQNDDIDKAEWTNSENTAAFCSLCVEEITAGNRSNGFMTARGRSPSGGTVAIDEFWKKHTKGHAAWRKLKYGPPENLSELEIMFEHLCRWINILCGGEQMDDEATLERREMKPM